MSLSKFFASAGRITLKSARPLTRVRFVSSCRDRSRSPMLLALEFGAVLALALPCGAQTRLLTREQLLDKIKGGWAGQIIGVSYGAPTEFRVSGRINDAPLDWSPGCVTNALGQDDLYVEMTFAKVMDDIGLDATCEQYGEAFKNSKYRLWHANAGARRALNDGIKAPLSGNPKYNFHANDIDFQIESDFIGMMCPGLPRELNKYAERVGRVMNYGDGLYGGMFIGGMYSAAFFENDPRRIVEAGLACMPPGSQYAALIRDLLAWSREHPNDWRKVWQMVEDKWDKNDACPDGALSKFNIDAKINGSYVAFGLLFGGGDFYKTMEIATRCGLDSDCNPSSAVGVLGVVLGYNKIPDQFKSALPAQADSKFDYTEYSFNSIVRSTEARALKVIESAGGKVSGNEVAIPAQTAQPPELEQWTIIPERRINARDEDWKWTGDWQPQRGMRISRSAGNTAELEFTGVGVAVLGDYLSQDGGKVDVYLDGKNAGVANYYTVPDTYENVLWCASGLSPGKHTVRLVTRPDADPRSSGHKVVVRLAVTYRAGE